MTRIPVVLLGVTLALGILGAGVSEQSLSGQEKGNRAVPKDVKFACSQHGPADMTFTLSLESGTSRKVEFIGGDDTTKWILKIDGVVDNKNNGETIKVRSGDAITWSVASKKHGVVFAEQDLAQAMLDFDMKIGKPLVDQTMKLTSTAWKKFGTKRWGTDPTNDVGVLAACKVK